MGFVPNFLIELLSRRWLWVGVALFCVGLAVFLTTDDPFKDLGLGLSVAMVVAVTTEALVGEQILGGVGTAVKRIDEALARLGIVNQAQAAGVYGIYTRFTPEEEGVREIRRALDAQLRSGRGEFRVLGVAAPCLFGFGPTRQLFAQHMANSSLKVRAILVDGSCPWAGVRAGLEQTHGTADHIEEAFGYLRDMRDLWGRERVDYKPTDIPLPAFVVITDEWAFVEPYPIAVVTGPLGGRTPMLKLKRDTTGYEVWSETFELLWRHPQYGDLHAYAEHLSRYGQTPPSNP